MKRFPIFCGSLRLRSNLVLRNVIESQAATPLGLVIGGEIMFMPPLAAEGLHDAHSSRYGLNLHGDRGLHCARARPRRSRRHTTNRGSRWTDKPRHELFAPSLHLPTRPRARPHIFRRASRPKIIRHQSNRTGRVPPPRGRETSCRTLARRWPPGRDQRWQQFPRPRGLEAHLEHQG